MVPSIQMVIQTAKASASPTQKASSMANAVGVSKSCQIHRSTNEPVTNMVKTHTCKDGSVDTEGPVESDGDSDGTLVLKQTHKDQIKLSDPRDRMSVCRYIGAETDNKLNNPRDSRPLCNGWITGRRAAGL